MGEGRRGAREPAPEQRARIEAYAREHMGVERGHDYGHADRARRWARLIARGEGYDRVDLVEAAALLHDVGLAQPEDRRNHGQAGAQAAAEFLEREGLFERDDIAVIAEAIRYHDRNREGAGPLLDVLRDADMMEIFGAVGILRSPSMPICALDSPRGETWGFSAADFDARFDSGIRVGDTMVDFLNFHISCLDNLATETARTLARPRVEFVRAFIEELEQELEAIQREDESWK